jgi:nonsense-mediated mRNA decay protein 3
MQSRYDIGAGIAKQVQQHTCRGCNRYERRDGGWAAVDPESKELLALLLKKPRGLSSVRLADASFIWTEPHSKRLKLRLTIQKEVVAGAVLQQSFVVEYVIGNKQCPHCQRREAKDTWMAAVQVRQKVAHKRTFLWLEQLILRHGAHADAVNITELKDGLDFFFDQNSHAQKFVSFLESVAPTRYKTSAQVISQDTHTGKGKTKSTYSVEVLPLCKDDLIWLPRQTAVALGHMSQLALCSKVSNVVHLLDPFTLKAGEMQPLAFWKAPFKAALSRGNLAEFVVLDLELRDPEWQTRGRKSGYRSGRDAWALADVTVARRADFGANDRRASAVTHLGNVLKVGDYVWGYLAEASPCAPARQQRPRDNSGRATHPPPFALTQRR